MYRTVQLLYITSCESYHKMLISGSRESDSSVTVNDKTQENDQHVHIQYNIIEQASQGRDIASYLLKMLQWLR